MALSSLSVVGNAALLNRFEGAEKNVTQTLINAPPNPESASEMTLKEKMEGKQVMLR